MRLFARLSAFVFAFAFLLVLAPLSSHAGPLEKNYGVAPDVALEQGARAAADSSPSDPYSPGDRVRAVVDAPAASDCINAGDEGTIVCYDASDPNLPYLVNWDNGCGFAQDQVCGVMAEHGWWVGFDEVELVDGGDPTPPPVDGACATFDLFTGILHLPCLDLGTEYWVDLKITGSDPKITFEVVDFGPN
jgi:hypothetical protein